MKTRGLIQVYSGNGKGKTTASVGQAVRAKGCGLKVCFVYFHKDSKAERSGEMKILKKIGLYIFGFARKHPCHNRRVSLIGIKAECTKALNFIRETLFKKNYDLMILDEIIVSIRDGFVKEDDVLSLLKEKPRELEIILTGRGATTRLKKETDLVSEIKKIKHPYDSGVKLRKGIEY